MNHLECAPVVLTHCTNSCWLGEVSAMRPQGERGGQCSPWSGCPTPSGPHIHSPLSRDFPFPWDFVQVKIVIIKPVCFHSLTMYRQELLSSLHSLFHLIFVEPHKLHPIMIPIYRWKALNCKWESQCLKSGFNWLRCPLHATKYYHRSWLCTIHLLRRIYRPLKEINIFFIQINWSSLHTLSN